MSIIRSFLTSCLVILLSISVGSCNKAVDTPQTSSTQSTPVAATSEPSTSTSESIKFKQEDGAEAFVLRFMPDGAKLVNGKNQELVRLNVDGQQKIKIKNATDQVLGYVVPENDYWKLKNSDQSQELYVVRRQNDGDYKLETGTNQLVYRIKVRDYGFEIETPQKQSLYKVKVKEGKVSLRNASDQTVLSTKSNLAPIAIAPFGFDKLSQEQQVALAYALNQAGGQ
ncbi:MAG: hypothetical protein KME12_11805 [Trichocoleus desertorum ATA4-8-CV12]|jgi:hypothetical protein|nr:hypothetical protein [Trichocoleus desertorum ATA4-8-CV12]